jgi:cell division protein FtsW (lipid II flippase)
MNGSLHQLELLLPTATARVQAGLWLFTALALVYAAWEAVKRRRAARKQSHAQLVALPGGRLPAGHNYEVNGQEIVIGRGEKADLRLERPAALSHAAICPRESEYWLRDLGSREGVQLNGRRLTREANLQDGDLLEIAGNSFRFHLERRGGWRPELWNWFLLLGASAFFVFVQWAAWSVAGPRRPPEGELFGWAGGLVAGAWAAVILVRRRRGTLDPLLVPAALMLLGVGFAVLLRAQPALYSRQTAAAAMGLAVFTGAALLPLQVLARYRYLALVGGVGLLITTLIFGHSVGDQHLAISIFGLSFQPAEPAKLLLAVFLAGLLSERQELVARTGRNWMMTRSDVRYLGPMVLAWGVALGLLIVQRDLGTALLFFGLFVAFVGMASGRAIFVLVSLGAFGFAAVLSTAAFDRVRERVDLWLNPWQDPRGLGYQLSQGLFALGAGGVEGVGLGNGFPWLVPAAHTDLPMAVIGEELGLIGTLAVLAVLGVLIMRGYRAAVRSGDDFLGLLAAGLTTVLALQALVIVGGLVRMLPLTGVTLPFISFGGTSLITNLALVGVLVGVSSNPVDGRPVSDIQASRYSWKRQLRWVMAAACLGFIVLGTLLFQWQVEASQALTSHQNNPRLAILAPRIRKGKILSADNKIIADSVRRDGKYILEVPSGSLMAGVLGYTSQRHGRTGVMAEAYHELLGARQIDSISDALDRAKAGTPGDNARLTIDLGLQETAARALGTRKGSIVAIDPRTGAIRAMVSFPRYSLHRIDERWDELVKDRSQPLLFPATHGVYPPGSTFKVVTAAVALDSGVVTPETRFSCPGAASIGNYTWNCYHGHAHGRITFADALRLSCNVTFGKVGLKLGKERLVAGARRLGIGEAAPMAVATGRGLLDPYNEPWGSVPAQIGFGQGPLAVTPLQMALVAAGIANDGVIMKPYLIQNYETPDRRVYGKTVPTPWLRSIKPQAARQVRQMMAGVVRAGTGTGARLPNITVGGKTGTAENPHGDDHAWFVSLAPVEKPELAVAVIVEGGGLGGRIAAPVARQVLAAYFHRARRSGR